MKYYIEADYNSFYNNSRKKILKQEEKYERRNRKSWNDYKRIRRIKSFVRRCEIMEAPLEKLKTKQIFEDYSGIYIDKETFKKLSIGCRNKIEWAMIM